MKKCISKILTILLLSNVLAPLSALASDDLVLTNRGNIVALTTDLQSYNDEIYISIADLGLLSITSNFVAPELIMSNIDNDVIVYLESSVVILNGVEILYQNPLILINHDPYVSLEFVAKIFSSIYEFDSQKNIIQVSITPIIPERIKGVIELPTGKTAPEGGLSLDVFVGNPLKSGSTGDDVWESYGGYPGTFKPEIPNATDTKDYDYINKKTIIIPEYLNSVEFMIEAATDRLNSKTYVGYSIDYNEYSDTFAVPYYSFYKDTFRFQISDQQKRIVSGSVHLPQAANEATSYTIIAYNSDYIYTYEGAIETGQIISDFSFHVLGNKEYTLSIIFHNGKYKRTDYNETIFVGTNDDISGILLNAFPSNKIEGTLILPDGFTAENDITAKVILQGAQQPFYYLDKKEITIPYGSRSVPFELLNEMDLSDAIVYYQLSNKVDGLYKVGHFSSVGTASTVNHAELVTFDSAEIEIPILKTKEISTTIQLPDHETADANIYGNVYAIPNFIKTQSTEKVIGGGGSLGSQTALPLIKEGFNNGAITLTIPDEDNVNYNVAVFNIYGSDRYFNLVYYKENDATVLKSNATLINSKSDQLEITLMKQNIVCGTIETNVMLKRFIIYAFPKDDLSVISDVYNFKFFSYDIDENHNFKIRVPSEFKSYIFAINPNKEYYYYSQIGTTKDINLASIISVNSNIENLNFQYEALNPFQPLKITSISQDVYKWNVTIENTSDFDLRGIQAYAAFYDTEKRLIKMCTENINLIYCNELKELSFPAGNVYQQAAIAKIFLWSEAMQPLSDTCIFKNILQDANTVFQIDSTIMLINGEKHIIEDAPILSEGQMIAPLRAIVEALSLTADWNGETQCVTIGFEGNVLIAYLNSTSATFNGEEIVLGTPLQVVNNRTFAPVRDIAQYFGYQVKWDSATGTLSIFDPEGNGNRIY